MELVTNEINTADVRYETLQGREYLVTDVTAVRAMNLNGGYVPGEEWQKSAWQWSRMPLPIGHPTNAHGDYISARSREVVDNAVVGDFYSVNYDSSTRSLDGELWIDLEQSSSIGGYAQMAVDMLENGEPLEVSTAYRAEEGEPGYYDGEYRQQVKVDLKPDHLALLPGDLGPGKCSVEDGCGTGTQAAVANADQSSSEFGVEPLVGGYIADGPAGESAERVYLNMKLKVLQNARTPEYDSTTSDEEWERPSLDDYISAYYSHTDANEPDDRPSDVSDLSSDAAEWIAKKSLLGDPDADQYTELVYFPVVDPSSNDLSESALESVLSTLGSAGISEDQADSVESKTKSLLRDEFDQSFEGNQTDEGSDDSPSPTVNLSEGDTVYWETDDGKRYGTIVDTLEDRSDAIVMVEPYALVEGTEWERVGGEITVSRGKITVIDALPEASDVKANGSTPIDRLANAFADALRREQTPTLNEFDSPSSEGGPTGTESGGEDSAEDSPTVNVKEGDAVNWESDSGQRFGIVVDELEDESDAIVLVQPYTPDNGEEWSDSGSTETVRRDTLTEIEQFPDPEDVEANANEASLIDRLANALRREAVADSPGEGSEASTDSGPIETRGCGCESDGGACTCADHGHSHNDDSGTDSAVTESGSASADDDDSTGTDAGVDDSDTGADANDNDNDTSSMSDFDLEAISNKTGISVDDLKELNDELLSNLADLEGADTNDGDGSDDDEPDAASDDGDGSDDDEPDAASDDSDDSDDDEPDVNDLEQRIEAMEEKFDSVLENGGTEKFEDSVESKIDAKLESEGLKEVAANHREEKQTKRERLQNTILSNTDAYDEETVEAMSDDALEATASELQPSSGTDFGARTPESATTTVGNRAEESDADGPSTVGTMSDWQDSE
jgi:hypothetical protein